jgi:primosomal protein N' (replication factor Y)
VDADSPLPKRRRSPAVVVGTQAAIWALHSREVGAAVAADLDQMLGRPDFRAGERTLGLLEDMVGLLGPGSRMLLQTREPEHHAVQAFTRRSYRFFADRELPSRKAAGYPPYGAVVSADTEAGHVSALSEAVSAGGGTLIGPLARPGGRAASLIRAPELDALLGPLASFVAGHPTARLDVDPIDVG